MLDVDDADEREAVRPDHRLRQAPELVVPLEQAGEALADGPGPHERLLLDDGERRQRQDPDHRAHLDRHDRAVGAAELVVVEPVLLVPEPLLLDRLRDECEVLEELEDEVGRGA